MVGAVGSRPNREDAFQELARLGDVAEVVVDHGEVKERGGHFRVVVVVRPLLDRERAL